MTGHESVTSMERNPYSPAPEDTLATPRRSIACSVMFGLSLLFATAAILLAIYMVYAHSGLIPATRSRLSPFAIGTSLLYFACGAGLIYCAALWRKQRVAMGMSLLVFLVTAFLFGPRLLLWLPPG